MNELVNDVIKLSKLEINTGFINRLPKKWLASLFGKLKYKENLIDSIYETEKKKSLVSATPLSTAFFSTVQNFQDTPVDEEDTRSIPSYQSPFQPKPLSSSQHKPELRPTKDFKAKYNKVKAKLALLSLSASASKAATIKNKGLIVEAYEWDEEEVKEGARNSEWVKISMRKKRILGVDQLTEDPSCSEQKDIVFVKSSADDTKLSHKETIDPLVAVTNSSATDYDSADVSSVCSTPLPPLKKLDGAEPVSRPKTIKSFLRSKSTFKAETLKGVIINEPSSAPAKGNKISPALKVNLAPVGKLKSVKIKDDPPLAINWETCGSNVYTTSDHNDIEWFMKREVIQAKKVESFKARPELNGKAVNESQYRGMIGSLMNLTACKPDIQFLTGLYARHQANIRNPTLLLLRELSAMFSAEAEDIAATGCCTNILWIKSQLTGYDIIYEKEVIKHEIHQDMFLSLIRRRTMRIPKRIQLTIQDEPSISLPPREEVERLLALTTPPPSPLTPLSSPLPQISSPPLPIPLPPPNSPTHIEIPESFLPLRKRDRPTLARDDPYSIAREDLYGFVDMVDVPPRCSTSKELDYDITDTWDDLVGAIDEIAPTTVEGVN
ncbi:hypothetical protein Tco_0425496 [Tanacetum coccineum]